MQTSNWPDSSSGISIREHNGIRRYFNKKHQNEFGKFGVRNKIFLICYCRYGIVKWMYSTQYSTHCYWWNALLEDLQNLKWIVQV